MPHTNLDQRRAYQREWLSKRRADWMADKQCIDCGSTERLEIDHRDPATKISHRVFSWRVDRRDAELAKCDVRCHECHKIRTISQQTKPFRHGTRTAHRSGCRCDPCRSVHAQHMREWRAKRRAERST